MGKLFDSHLGPVLLVLLGFLTIGSGTYLIGLEHAGANKRQVELTDKRELTPEAKLQLLEKDLAADRRKSNATYALAGGSALLLSLGSLLAYRRSRAAKTKQEDRQ